MRTVRELQERWELEVSLTEESVALFRRSPEYLAMKEALEFYASPASWEIGPSFAQNNYIVDGDLYCSKGDQLFGGKAARRALEAIK